MKKRFLSALLSLCMLLTLLPVMAQAEGEEDKRTAPLSSTLAVIEMQESYAELPAYYNAIDEGLVTCIKRQNGPTCWAYATITSVETSFLKQGIAQDHTTLDLSEALLVDAMFTRSDDPLHNTTGDMNFCKNVRINTETSWAAQMLAGGLSLADEQEYLSRGEGHQFDTDLNMADFWSCAFIPTTEEDLKRAIYQYGSVSISGWSPWHAVALIGWDDDYEEWPLKYDDFVLVPGVFLEKDSDRGVAGEYRFNYWVPYDDITYIWDDDGMPQHYDAIAFTYRDKDTYDNVYLYDGSGFSGEVEAQKAAAIFEAKAGTDTLAEQIVSATLPLASLDMTASVQIYTSLKDASNPESGTPLFETGNEPTIHADYSGMYSIDFTEFGKAIPLHQGELFSVVMTLPNGGSVITACDGEYFDCYNSENIEQGQTFFYGYDNIDGWVDGLDLSHTARLHVQTKMIPISELPPSDVHEHNWSSEWKTDAANHWHECECGDKGEEAAHTEDEGTVTKEPTQEEMGVKTFACSVCGYIIRTERIPATGGSVLGGLVWSVDAAGKLTLAGEFPDDGTIWVASWNSEGHFLSAKVLTAQRGTVQLEPDWVSLKLLWLNGNLAPQCAAVTIEK